MKRRLARWLRAVVSRLDPQLVFSPDISVENDRLRVKIETCERELAELRRRGF